MKHIFMLLLAFLCLGCTREPAFDAYMGDDEPITYVTNYSTIRVYIEPDIPRMWRKATDSAMHAWNQIGCRLQFVYADKSAYDVRVYPYFDSSTVTSSAALPASDLQPGKYIKVNTLYNTMPVYKLQSIMKHELGHVVGLRHIKSRPSIMNPSVLPGDDINTQDRQLIIWLFK